MKRIVFFIVFCSLSLCMNAKKTKLPLFPDGTPIPEWFRDTTKVDVNTLGKKYVVTDYGVKTDSTIIQTRALQSVIDKAAQEGGGVIVIPQGTFLSGNLFFKQGTHLHVVEGGKLKGSERIEDFEIRETRIEGQTCKYFTALVNADGIDGFTITGKGTIDGNGYHYWKEFWIRREWNRQCTNKDAQRPRLTYISNCKNVTVQDVRLINSPFWTNHVYRSDHVRYLDLYIYSSTEGVKGPSTDAIDIDVCHDVLIRGCYMNVNDDAVVLKGGKGTFADQDPNNGPCYNIIVENCRYGTVHGCLTLGSESLHDWNIIIRNCHAENTNNVLWLKMRPDTPQHYEFVTVENFTGLKMDFYVKVSFAALVYVVDAMGGIDVDSDTEFTAWTNPDVHIEKGINHMDGVTALAYARERYAYEDGDMHRAQNQAQVLREVAWRAMSPGILIQPLG